MGTLRSSCFLQAESGLRGDIYTEDWCHAPDRIDAISLRTYESSGVP